MSQTLIRQEAQAPLYWTYADVAEEFGHSVHWLKRKMTEFESRGFPTPVPWSRREKRWSPDAVRAWRRREELRAGALGAPDLHIVEGGRR